MRRIPLALALVGAVAVTGCMSGGNSSAGTDSDVQKGVTGQYYYVNINQPPVGGSITSNIGGINCGASAVAVNNAVTPPQYTYTYISNACGTNGQTQIPWASSVVLTAVPATGKAFIGWAGDCSGTALTCTVSTAQNGADKTVIAIFGEPGSGHGMPFPGSVHGPAVTGGTFDCFSCHGNLGQGQSIAPSCTTCHTGTPPAKTGLRIAVQGITSTATNIVVQFTVKDDLGGNIDLTGADGKNTRISPRVALASFSNTGGIVSSYATRTGTATRPSTVTLPVVGAPAGTSGELTGTPGSYTYTFPATVTFDPTKSSDTHTLWFQAARQENLLASTSSTFTPVNYQFNFLPGAVGVPVTAGVAAKREVASQAGCDNCHNAFKPAGSLVGGFHGAGRIEVAYCNVCHTSATDRTPLLNGAWMGSSAQFIHTLHGAHQLHVPTANLLEGIAATYPQAISNCTTCHAGAAQGDQWMTRPTREACGSCHYDVDFATGVGHGPSNVGGPQANDALCAVCHGPSGGYPVASSHFQVTPPDSAATWLGGTNSRTNAGYLAVSKAIPAGASRLTVDLQSVSMNASRQPVLVFKLVRDTADVVFNTAPTDTAVPAEMITDFVGSIGVYAAFGVPQDGISASNDFNARVSNNLKAIWKGITTGTSSATIAGPVDGYYTVTFTGMTLPTNATILTGGIGYDYSLPNTQPLTQTNVPNFPAADYNITSGTFFGKTCSAADPCVAKTGGLIVPIPNVWKTATGFAARRTIVNNDKCNACHGTLGVAPTFHVGQRNDGPTCSFCHNPNQGSSAWSANASTFVHGIHGASKRTVEFNWHSGACPATAPYNATERACVDPTLPTTPAGANHVAPLAPWYPEIEYPNQLKNCEACHDGNSQSFAGATVQNLLWSTVAKGTYANTVPSTSPYVEFGVSYGSGFSYTIDASGGATVEATSATLVNSPISAACFSCHDSASARSHMEAMGGWIYKARGAAFSAPTNAETCLGCHGAGKAFPIDLVH